MPWLRTEGSLEGFLEEAGGELVRRASPAGASVSRHRGPKEEAVAGGGAAGRVGDSLSPGAWLQA